jgi:hypothetical protein
MWTVAQKLKLYSVDMCVGKHVVLVRNSNIFYYKEERKNEAFIDLHKHIRYKMIGHYNNKKVISQ